MATLEHIKMRIVTMFGPTCITVHVRYGRCIVLQIHNMFMDVVLIHRIE